MSGHIKNSVKSIIFFGSGKKKREGPALFSRPIKKVFMVAEALKKRRVSFPLFFYYYDIVAYFLYRNDSLNNGLFFWKYCGLVWV